MGYNIIMSAEDSRWMLPRSGKIKDVFSVDFLLTLQRSPLEALGCIASMSSMRRDVANKRVMVGPAACCP